MSKQLIDNAVQALVTINAISLLPKTSRQKIDESEFKQATLFIAENYPEIFKTLTEKDFFTIQVSDFKIVKEFAYTLDEDATRVPSLIGRGEEHLSGVLIKLYEAQSTIQGLLEELYPMLERWEKIYERAEAIAKALSLNETEWASEALFHVAMPPETCAMIDELREVVGRAKIRRDSLKQCYDIASRLVTIQLADPTEPGRTTAEIRDAEPRQERPKGDKKDWKYYTKK